MSLDTESRRDRLKKCVPLHEVRITRRDNLQRRLNSEPRSRKKHRLIVLTLLPVCSAFMLWVTFTFPYHSVMTWVFGIIGALYAIFTIAAIFAPDGIISSATTDIVDGMFSAAQRAISSRNTLVAAPPGYSLRRFIRFFTTQKGFSEVFEPTFGDMETEYHEALARADRFEARKVVLAYYLKIAILLVMRPMVRALAATIGWLRSN